MKLEGIASQLESETAFKSNEVPVKARIGANFGRVQLYKNAQGKMVPTGRNCYIAEQVARDVDEGSIVCAKVLGKFGGESFKPGAGLPPLEAITLPGIGSVERYLLQGRLKAKKIAAPTPPAGPPVSETQPDVSIKSSSVDVPNKADPAISKEVDENLDKGLQAAVRAFRDALIAIKNEDLKSSVAGVLQIPKAEIGPELDGRIRQILHCECADGFFAEAMGGLAGCCENEDVTEEDKRSIHRLQEILTRRVFTDEALRSAAHDFRFNRGVAAVLSATELGPEVLTSSAAGLKPDFRFSGRMHMVNPPIGRSSPEALVVEILRDLTYQAGFELPQGGHEAPTEATALSYAGKLKEFISAQNQFMDRARRPLKDKAGHQSPLCYCVFPRPENDRWRSDLHALVRKIAALLPGLLFFELSKEAKTAGDEHVALQYIGGRLAHKPNKSSPPVK